MKQGICPKCDSRDVYACDWKSTPFTSGTGESLLMKKNGGFLANLSSAKLEYYICAVCGYLETYAQHTEDLSALKESTNWRRV